MSEKPDAIEVFEPALKIALHRLYPLFLRDLREDERNIIKILDELMKRYDGYVLDVRSVQYGIFLTTLLFAKKDLIEEKLKKMAI